MFQVIGGIGKTGVEVKSFLKVIRRLIQVLFFDGEIAFSIGIFAAVPPCFRNIR